MPDSPKVRIMEESLTSDSAEARIMEQHAAGIQGCTYNREDTDPTLDISETHNECRHGKSDWP